MRLCMSESSGELTPPLESPEEVSKTGQMLAGLLAASPEPVTLGMLAEWTGNSSEEVQTELVRLGYNPLTPVGELGVLLRVSQKELSDETEKLQKRHGVDEIRSEKDIPGVYGNERLDYAVRLIKLKSLREQTPESLNLSPESPRSSAFLKNRKKLASQPDIKNIRCFSILPIIVTFAFKILDYNCVVFIHQRNTFFKALYTQTT